jgi:SAM-dependent methyltransferase
VLGCLGATAAQAVFGSNFRVTKQRGQWLDVPGAPDVQAVATIHPSAVLRAREDVRDVERHVAGAVGTTAPADHVRGRGRPLRCDAREPRDERGFILVWMSVAVFTLLRARPPLPEGLVETIVELSGLPAGGRVLEVGCGTGSATRAFAERGYQVVAVELGAELAAHARADLAAFAGVRVDVAAFEHWPLDPEPFDLVTAFHAWHWLDQDAARRQAAAALRPGGVLAIVGGQHVAGGDTEFFHAAQRCYERFMPGTPPGERLHDADAIPPTDWGLHASGGFTAAEYRRWVQVDEYTIDGYFDLLRSFSTHIALAPVQREQLFACLRELLETQYDGRVRRATLTELYLTRLSPGR